MKTPYYPRSESDEANRVCERRGTPDEGVVYPGSEFWDSIYELEEEIEEGSTRFRERLKELLGRIIEKRLEYYWPPPEPEE